MQNVDEIVEMDRNVGLAIKKIRILKGLTQTDLSKILGVSVQQTQKYEQNTNRISAGKLFYLLEKLNLICFVKMSVKYNHIIKKYFLKKNCN